MTAMLIKVTTTGQSRSGISVKQKPYTMATAYAHLPNVPFPQEFPTTAPASSRCCQLANMSVKSSCLSRTVASLSRSIRAKAVALLLQLQPLHGQLPDGRRRTHLHG